MFGAIGQLLDEMFGSIGKGWREAITNPIAWMIYIIFGTTILLNL